MLTELLNHTYFSLFLIVALGFIVGRIKVKGISLDLSAVIFIAMVFGHFGVSIPKELGNFGLVIFIFTIGIQAGPGFIGTFTNQGKTIITLTLLITASAALTALGLKAIMDIDTASTVGLMAGALTSTPGLAVAIDSTNSPMASIAYGVAYPFGVIGVILFVKLLPRLLRADLQEEAAAREQASAELYPELKTAIFRITNLAIDGKSLAQIKVRSLTGAIVSRIRKGNDILIPKSNITLEKDDCIQAVGSDEALDKLAILIGEREEGELPLHGTQAVESLFLTKQSIVNRRLGELQLQQNFGCTVTRVRRSGITISPSPDLELKFGDKLMCVGERDGLTNLAHLFGNDEKRLSDTDLFPIAMGIVLGIIAGQINISLPGLFTFTPGLTGGILLTALVLSAIGKSGPIIWTMSGPANQLLRQLGLILFLAEVGTSAGHNLVADIRESGVQLLIAGSAITVVPMAVATIVGRYIFRLSTLDMIGTIIGGMTSTPGLAAADSMTTSNIPSVAYATAYPISMIILILFIQILSAVT